MRLWSPAIGSFKALWLGLIFASLAASAEAQAPEITTERLPNLRLWEPYRFLLEAKAGTEPYHWRLTAGRLPDGFVLDPTGAIRGTELEAGEFEFTVAVADSSEPPSQQMRKFVLITQAPLAADWEHPARVDGQRIQGSLKVSNQSGRDFDLTVIVLAVNEIGRATAIGYQHFTLAKETSDLAIPFGETVSPGSYVVHVDVVAEEPLSRHIFRTRLVVRDQKVSAPL